MGSPRGVRGCAVGEVVGGVGAGGMGSGRAAHPPARGQGQGEEAGGGRRRRGGRGGRGGGECRGAEIGEGSGAALGQVAREKLHEGAGGAQTHRAHSLRIAP